MPVNKIIITLGILLTIFIVFVMLQFNPFGSRNTSVQDGSTSATVSIKEQSFKTIVAESEEDKQKGLSGRESLPMDEGMLFLFDKAELQSFWMKDMKFPIDIIFINGEKIVSISENVPPPTNGNQDLPIYQPTGPSDKVFEINAGLSEKYDFNPGDTVDIKIE